MYYEQALIHFRPKESYIGEGEEKMWSHIEIKILVKSSNQVQRVRTYVLSRVIRIIVLLFFFLSFFSFSVFVNICSIVFPSPISSHEFPFNTRDSSFKSTNEQHKLFKCPRNLYFSAKTSKFRCLIIF